MGTNQPIIKESYYVARLKMETQLRGSQRKLEHERRLIHWWVIIAISLILILAIGIAGGTYLSLAWHWLTFLGIIGLLIYGLLFCIFATDAIRGAWNHRKEVKEINDQLQLLDEAWKQTPNNKEYMEYYRQVLVPQVVEDYRKQSKVNRFVHLVLQMTIIISSLLVTGLTSGLDTKLGLTVLWLAPGLSFLVSLCTAVMGFFKFRERSFHMQQTADTIDQERTALKLGIRRYRDHDPQAAFVEFAEQVELLREEQRKRQQQLEQASDSKEAHATA